MGNEASTRKTQRQEAAREKERRALTLKNLGLSYAEISKEMGYKHPRTSHKLVQRALKRIPFDAAQEFRQRQLLQLDELLRTQMPTALQPVPAVPLKDKDGNEYDEATRLMMMDARARSLNARHLAVETSLKIMSQAARIAGIEVQKQEHSGPNGGEIPIGGSGVRIYLPKEEQEPD